MSSFPQELVFVLVFGAVVLAQFFFRQLRRRAALMQAELEPQARAQAEAAATATATATATAVLLKIEPKPAQTNAVGLPQAVQAPRASRVAAETYASRQPRRFSRQNLMADRRAIQDAIVIAAIMQPCHAQRPYNVD
jgi:hypothetical protein